MSKQGTFNVLKAKRDGLDALIVIDTGLNADLLSKIYPWLLIITLPIVNANELGLPDQAESDRLGEIEDQLLEGLDPTQYRYVGHVTWNNKRDVFIYVNDPDNAIERINSQLSKIDQEDIQLTIDKRHEPDSKTYRQFLSRLP
jgi:hypothetical protein